MFKKNKIKNSMDDSKYFNVKRLQEIKLNKMSKFLVTGGAGFIGSHLVDLLVKNNHKLIIIDNLSTGHKKNLEHLKGNNNILFLERDCLNLNLKNISV